MKMSKPMIRALSVVLVLCMVISMSPAAHAWSFADLFRSGKPGNELVIEKIDGVDADVKLELEPVEHPYQEDKYENTDMVRVSIVLKDLPTLEKFSTKGISPNTNAVSYRQSLRTRKRSLPPSSSGSWPVRSWTWSGI